MLFWIYVQLLVFDRVLVECQWMLTSKGCILHLLGWKPGTRDPDVQGTLFIALIIIATLRGSPGLDNTPWK